MLEEAFSQNPINPGFELADSYVYQQYRHLEWCIKYFAIVDNLINQYFVDTINDYIKAMSIQNSNSQYLTFYLKNLLGIERPMSAASLLNYYDIGLQFDNKLKYDDSQNYGGKLNQRMFLIYLHYILNYKYEIFNIPFLIDFIAEWCEINKNDLEVIPGWNKITIQLSPSLNAILFSKIIINYYNQMSMPLGVDFNIETQTKDK